jgi:hypothetical protein
VHFYASSGHQRMTDFCGCGPRVVHFVLASFHFRAYIDPPLVQYRRYTVASIDRRGRNWRVRLMKDGERKTKTFDTRAQCEAWLAAGCPSVFEPTVSSPAGLARLHDHLYIMQNEQGAIKIGRTRNVERRRRGIETGSGNKIRLVFEQKHAGRNERRLHEALAEFRTLGEWFRDTPEFRAILATELGQSPWPQ